MSQTVDSRVVEMKFDNKNFEKNVAESMKTLESLSKRLDNLENTQVNLDKVGRAADSLDLSKIDKALDSITHRFSIMGQIGASVLHNLTTDAYNLAKGLTSKVWNTTFGQIKAGGKARASNVENAKFLLEGMGIAFSDEVDNAISEAVADTAFGYDEAAMAMAQLSGASVQLGSDMDQALKAISGVAAMTNRSFSDIADIFVDSAAAGKVAGDAFNRLGERGLAAKGIMQEFYGVTADELDKMARAGKISFNDFSKAMYEAFGTQAKKSNETLSGVLANTKAVLSRIGQSFYQPLMANNSDVVLMFQSLKDVMKGFEKFAKPVGKEMAEYVLKLARYGKGILDGIDVSKYEVVFTNLSTTFKNLTIAGENLYSNVLKPFAYQFKMALYEVFPSLNTGKSLIVTISDKIVELSEKFRTFTAEIGLFGDKGASVRDTLISIFNLIKTGIKLLSTATTVLKAVIKAVTKLLGSINISGILRGTTDFLNEAIEIGSFIISGIVVGLSSAVPLVIQTLGNVCRAIIEAFCSFFQISSPSKVMAKLGYWLVAGVAEGIKTGLKAGLITGAILLVFGLIMRQFKEGEENVLQTISRLFNKTIDKIAEVFMRFSNWLSGTAFGKAFKATFEALAVVLTKVSDAVKTFNYDKFKQIFGTFKQFVMLGAYVYILVQFAAASTMFTTALYNISRAANKYMASMRLRYFGNTLKNLAIAIGVIVGSIMLFAGMIETGRGWALVQGLITIILMIVGLVAAVSVLMKAMKAEEFGPHGIIKVEAMFIGLAASVYLIATAIRKVGRMDWKSILAGAATIYMFLVAVAGIMLAIDVVSSGKSTDGLDISIFVSLLGIAIAVRILASAIAKVAKIPVKDVFRAAHIIYALTGIIGAIVILTEVLTAIPTAGEGNRSIFALALMMLTLGIAVKAISNTIIWLSYVPIDKIEQGKEIVRQIMGWLSALLFFSIFSSKVLGTILFGFAATVAAIAGAIWLIGQMESGIAKGINTIIGIMTIITVFVGAVNLVNKATGGSNASGGVKALLYAGICIAAMGAVIYAMKDLDAKQIWKGIGVVTALCAFAVVVGILLSLMTGKGEGKNNSWVQILGAESKVKQIGKTVKTLMVIKTIVNSLIKVALVALVFAKAIKSEDEITRSVLMMTGVIGILSLLLLAAGAIAERAPNIQKITKPIIALTAAILVISGALLLLGQMEAPATVITSMFAIGGILLAMGFVLEKAKTFGVQGMNVKAILALSVGIVAISAALTLMVAAIGEFSLNKLGTVLLAVGAIAGVIIAIAWAMKIADKTQVSMKSAGALILGSLSFLAVAATIALFAVYVKDMAKATQAAVILGGTFLAIGIALKLAETVHWSVAGAIFIASLSLVAIAGSVAGLAYFMDDLKKADEAAWILGGLFVTLGAVLAVLAGISGATEGIGAALILAIAAAMVAAGFAMKELAEAVYIAIQALQELIATLTPQNAEQVVGFFETIGDGIGTVGQHIAEGMKTAATSIHDAVASIKESVSGAGTDVAKGFAQGILSSKGTGLVVVAAAALGALAVGALKSKDGIDSASPSKKTEKEGENFDEGLGNGIKNNSDLATNPAKDLGSGIIDALKGKLAEGVKSTSFQDIWNGLKSTFTDWGVSDYVGSLLPGGLFGVIGKKMYFGVGKAVGQNAIAGVTEGAEEAVSSATGSGGSGGIMDMITGLFGGLTSGNFDNVLGGFDWSTLLGGDGVAGLKEYLNEAGVSMDNLSGDNIPKLIEKLTGAGLAGDDLINTLKELGITEDQLKNLGLDDKLGLDTAKEGAEELKTTIQDLADEIINGKFGNAPERWDRMFETLIKSGKTAEEAYAAIADAQNEVNKRLGNSVVHTAAEMEKKVSDSIKKANKELADANAKAKGVTGKSGKDFTKDPHKAVTDINKSEVKQSAEEQMKNNMPYANYLAAKEHQITGEREKQTAEVYKQKLANEHMYTLKEKEQAMAGLKANQELAANSTLSAEKQKQLDAENKKYQAVVDTYNKQQDMLKVIQEQEAATKKAEDAEKKRGEAIKASEGAVVYGSADYEKQKKGTTINNRKAIIKQETKPVEAETKVEVTPKFELKNVNVESLKTGIVNKVETEIKELNTKVDITPKVNTSQAETQIANFKQKTNELKTTIPETFNGIAQKVSEHFTKISSMVIQGGGKLTSNTRAVFQNAVSAATGVLTGSATISKFYNAGKQATQGYINGMKSNIAGVKTASAQLGNKSAKTVQSVLGIKSPSRVFMQIGGYAAEGYIIGLESYMGAVQTASSELSQSSVDGVYRVVDAVQNAVNSGMDLTPTITPVFDSVNIQNGLGDVSSMMDLSQRDIASISANIDAKANYDNSQVEAMQARMSDMQYAFNNLADILSNQETPIVEANVNLMGDANGVFKLVQNSNNRYKKMHGRSALA